MCIFVLPLPGGQGYKKLSTQREHVSVSFSWGCLIIGFKKLGPINSIDGIPFSIFSMVHFWVSWKKTPWDKWWLSVFFPKSLCLYGVKEPNRHHQLSTWKTWSHPMVSHPASLAGHSPQACEVGDTTDWTPWEENPWIWENYSPRSGGVSSRELTYPTWGKGNSSSKVPWDGIC